MSDNELIESLKEFEFFQEEERYNLDIIVDNKSLSSGQMQKLAFIRALSWELILCCSMNQLPI